MENVDLIKSIPPIISLVDDIIYKAILKTASDIHFEPRKNGLNIRYRIDGVLYYQEAFPNNYMLQIISRLKILANINIAEKRIPQDGKFRFNFENRSIDLRVSTFPSIYGEKVVVRILDRTKNMIVLDKLGLSLSNLLKLKNFLKKINGFCLVTGPTGSGKTTTLYAALNELNSTDKNIITLEDPVEYNLEGITQGQIKPEVGFSFDKGVRAMLRQDPDVVMIGEIRDKLTAQTAIEASLTGHLVLSTLHTNDAPSVIIRLMDMGIEPYLINASLSLVIAQRLARRICEKCKYATNPNEEELTILNKFNFKTDVIFKSKGCRDCFYLGYKGRIGVFEFLEITDKLRSLIIKNPSIEDIRRQALSDSMEPLLFDGIAKIKNGIISLEEFIKII